MRRVTVAILVLALGGSLVIGIAVGKMAGGAPDQSPTFNTTPVSGGASTPTRVPFLTLPPPTTPPPASPSATSGARSEATRRSHAQLVAGMSLRSGLE